MERLTAGLSSDRHMNAQIQHETIWVLPQKWSHYSFAALSVLI